MKKLLLLGALCLSTAVFAENAQPTTVTSQSPKLASESVEATNPAIDAPLLKKLKNKAKLTPEDKARLEVIYQMKYVGEEELNPVQNQIYKYAKKILSPATRKMIEKKADSQGM